MLDSLLHHALLSSLALTLLHFLWQGLFIGALSWLILQIVPRENARLRYGVCALAMIASLLSPLITFMLVDGGSQKVSLETIDTINLAGFTLPVAELRNSVDGFEFSQVFPVISLAYLFIVAYLSVKLIWQLRQVSQLKVSGVKAAEPSMQLAIERFSRQLGLRSVPVLFFSLKAQTPMVVGWLKPVVLLPAAMVTGLSREQLEMLLLHELAHIRRFDYLVNFLQTVVEILLFFHPSVKWVSKQMRQEREHCSDDIALQHCSNPIAYAHTLTDTAALTHQHIPQMAVAASGGDLKQRVVRIVEHHCTSNAQQGYFQLLAPLTVVCALLLTFSVQLSQLASVDFIRFSAPLISGQTVQDKLPDSLPYRMANSLLYSRLNINWLVAESEQQFNPVNVSSKNEVSLSQDWSEENKGRGSSEKLQQQSTNIASAAQTNQQFEQVLPSGNHTDTSIFNASASVDKMVAELKRQAEIITRREPPRAKYAAASEGVIANDIIEPQVTAQASGKGVSFHETAQLQALKPEPSLTLPVILKSVQPYYPKVAKRKGIETEVKVSYIVDKYGKIKDIKFEDQFGVGVFKQSIKSAMKKWRYQPANLGGEPVEMEMTKIFDFNLVI
jgi:TonB family protein